MRSLALNDEVADVRRLSAEALGATYLGNAVGREGAAAAFSFNGNKIITTSGGGMLASDDEADHQLIWNRVLDRGYPVI